MLALHTYTHYIVYNGRKYTQHGITLGDVVYHDTKTRNFYFYLVHSTGNHVKLCKMYVYVHVCVHMNNYNISSCTCITNIHKPLKGPLECIQHMAEKAHGREGTSYTGYIWRVAPEELLAIRGITVYGNREWIHGCDVTESVL